MNHATRQRQAPQGMTAITAWTAAFLAVLAACGGDQDDGGAPGAGGTNDPASSSVTASVGGNASSAGGSAGSATSAGGAAGHGGGDPLFFEEQDGLVAVEAESFVSHDNLGTPRDWLLTTLTIDPNIEPDPDPPHADGASGQACLEALPDTRVTHDDAITSGENFFPNAGEGATLSYRIWFHAAGTYVVWVRAYSTGTEDNGIHVGIDGSWPESGERVQFCDGKNKWTWSSAQRDSAGPCGNNGTITIDVDTPGEHLITFSMREDGFEFDKFVMAEQQSQANYKPQDAGPPEQLYVP
ncbi:MAG: hypothetical protein VB934_12715 [Polyangiaceae bacterium]